MKEENEKSFQNTEEINNPSNDSQNDSTIETEAISEIDSLQNQLNNEKEKYIRLFAEFENYKKRVTKERIDLIRTAGQDILTSLLPVLDDFERCVKELNKSENNELTKGIELINSKFIDITKTKGLQKMEIKMGDDFDVEKHEAITQIPAPNDELKEKIIDVVENGFTLGEKVIRYAKVIIGK